MSTTTLNNIKNSCNHGWFISIGWRLSGSRCLQNLQHIHRKLSFCYRIIPWYIAIFLWPIFYLKRPHTTRSGHDSPHLQPTTICSKFVFVLLLFIKDVLVCCLLNPPPCIHCADYTSSATTTAHKPLGTEQTHVVPVKEPLPLWWQPAHHHKMPQSPVCVKNSTKLRACLLKNVFIRACFLFLCI